MHELFKQLDHENAGSLSFENFMMVVFKLQDLQSLMKAAGFTSEEVNNNPLAIKAVEFNAQNVRSVSLLFFFFFLLSFMGCC